MKLFVVLLLAAAAAAKPSGIAAPLVVTPLVAASPVATQYHSQDELGQYSYGYSNAHSAKAEARSLDGITVGGYTYVDPEGKLQTVEYSSDVNGFKVAASNLPVPPAVPVAPVLPVPVPVRDTPEVVEARTKHLEALEAAKVHSAEVIAPAPAVTTVVQSISPLIPGQPAPLAIVGSSPLLAAKSIIPSTSIVAASPFVAAKSAEAPQPPAAAAEAPAQPSPAPSTEVPSTVATAEEVTTPVPSAEAKSAILPAGVSVLSLPTLGVRSLVAPTLPLAVPSVGATTYAINSLFPYGYTSVVANPAATAYTAQFVASVPGSVVKTSQAWAPQGKTEQGSK